MVQQFYTAHPLLQPFVNCIMVVHAELPKAMAAPVVIYPPTPQTSLFFYINDPIAVQMPGADDFVWQPKSVLVGQQLHRVAINVNHSHKSVRVGFHPGGLHRLLGISMAEMLDDSYDAEEVFGKEMQQLNEQLQYAGSCELMKDLIEGFLMSRLHKLKRALPFDDAMLELLKYGGNIPIEKVASLACLSTRQFERICKERIGLAPKLYARLVRFSKAYRLREDAPKLSWTHIAHECGYFDQMHFIRDFKEFAGTTPGIIDKKLGEVPVRMQERMRI